MESYVKRWLAQEGAIPRGARVLVALSGGRDSVCLLHCLLTLAGEQDWQILAAHLDHGIREESARDARFVKDLCREWNVPLTIGQEHVPEYRAQHKLSMEDAARRLRYRFLQDTAQKLRADVIALAHHAGDQTETMLLHLLRGSGLAGVAGMQGARGCYVRPMLCAPSHAVQDYFEKNGLSCVQDETNLDTDNPRNALRHRVIPELEAIAPAAQAAFARAAVNFREDEEALRELAQACLKDGMRDFGGVSARYELSPYAALNHRAILSLAQKAGLTQDMTRRALTDAEKLLRSGKGQCDLAHRYRAWVYRGRIWIGQTQEKLPEIEAQDGAKLAGFTLHRKTLPHAPQNFASPEPLHQVFAALPQGIVLRGMREGDFIRLPAGRKTLGDAFSDAHVPPWRRAGMPIVALGSEILWIPHTGWAQKNLFVQNPVEPVQYLWIQEEERP